MRETIEQTADNCPDPVHPQSAHNVIFSDRTADDFPERQEHPHRFNKDNQQHHTEGDNGNRLKRWCSQRHRGNQFEPGRIRIAVETDLIAHQRQHKTKDNPQ